MFIGLRLLNSVLLNTLVCTVYLVCRKIIQVMSYLEGVVLNIINMYYGDFHGSREIYVFYLQSIFQKSKILLLQNF